MCQPEIPELSYITASSTTAAVLLHVLPLLVVPSWPRDYTGAISGNRCGSTGIIEGPTLLQIPSIRCIAHTMRWLQLLVLRACSDGQMLLLSVVLALWCGARRTTENSRNCLHCKTKHVKVDL